MDTFEITPEMEASKGLRFANYLIDIFAVYAIFAILAIVIGIIAVMLGSSIDTISEAEDWKYNLVFCVMYFLYCFVFENFGGRTLGKLITGTMVVTEYGEKPETRQIAIRSICRFIPFDNFSFLFSTGWHDNISGTRVVKKHIYVTRKNEVVELDEIGEKSELL